MDTLFKTLSKDIISWEKFCDKTKFDSPECREEIKLRTKGIQELLIGKYILWKSKSSEAIDDAFVDYDFEIVMHITNAKYGCYAIDIIGDTATVSKDSDGNIININFHNKDMIVISYDVEAWAKEFKEISMEEFYKFVDDAKKKTNFFYPIREFEMACRNGDYDQKEYLSLLYKNTIKDVL